MKTKLFLSLLTVLLIFSAVAVSSAQSSPASGTGTYLQTVQIGNISNPNSGASNTSYSGYSIWTNITFQGTEGGAAPVHITYASAGATVQSTSIYSSAQIWIDYNDNGSFEAAEFCPFTLHTNLHQYNLNAHGTFADSFSDFISFPQGSAGTHLLRIRYLDQTISFDPDQDYTDNGETEDYRIHIAAQSCYASSPNLNSWGYVESDVESSDTLVLANNPMNLSINFYSNTFTCGYVQWYYSLGNSVPYALIAIPNSNNNNISFSPPDTGYIWIRATGLFGGNGDFFFTRGTSFYVQKCDSCGHTSDTTSTGGGTEPKPDILSYHSESKNQSVHTETNVNTSAKNTEVQVEPVKVYPNPFRDQLHIGSQNTDNTSICIFDVNGKKVLEELLDGDQGISSINTTSLAPGTYFLRISSDEENSIHTLIKSEK